MNGILERIEANQLEILALLKANPVAEAVGNAIDAPATAETPAIVTPVVNPVVAAAAVQPVVTNVQQPTTVVQPVVAQTASSELLELDKEGLPWDARINSANKAKTVKNVWKSKKGAGKLDAAATEAVKVELRATVAANPAAYKPFVEEAVVVPAVATNTPVVTTVVAPVVLPTAGAVVAPVVAPDVNAVAKGEAITHVNVLVETWKVEYDDILEVVETFGGAKSFDELAPEHYPAAALKFKTWVDWLTTCQVQIDAILAINPEIGATGVAEVCSQYGVDKTSGVHHAELNELHDKLKEYRAQWDAAVAAAGQ